MREPIGVIKIGVNGRIDFSYHVLSYFTIQDSWFTIQDIRLSLKGYEVPGGFEPQDSTAISLSLLFYYYLIYIIGEMD